MKRFMKISLQVLAIAWLPLSALATTAQAGFTSSLGVETHFLEPGGWNVGDALSTHQTWDYVGANTGNLPDISYDVDGALLTNPTWSVKAPGFRTGTSNFYSFSGDFGATADIYNHGGLPAGVGTHVIVQIGNSLNPDAESFPGQGTGVYLDSLKIVDLSGSPITGGDNASALQISPIFYADEVDSSFGLVSYQELVAEFWLPGYTGDFHVDWNQKVHSLIDTLRVDSMIATEAIGGGTPFALTAVPEPTGAILLGIGGIGLARFVKRRRKIA